jgi:hypothetical protein
MSNVRARSARAAPSKKIQPEYAITGRLRISWKTSSRRPNGAGTPKCKTWRPIDDQSRIGTDRTAATTNRLRMSWTMASIDIAPWPPCPITSCGERTAVSEWWSMRPLYPWGV